MTVFEEQYPIVKIKVTPALLDVLFHQSDNAYICLTGLKGEYKAIGVVQSEHDASYNFILYCPHTYKEGMSAIQFTPVYKNVYLDDEGADINYRASWWYRMQIQGLLYILDDNTYRSDSMISVSYIIEKLNLIMTEQGINFHPEIKRILDEDRDKVINNI